MPKWLTLPVVLLVYSTVDVGLPIAVSTFGRRHGWNGDRPGPLNLVGVALLVAGATMIVLAFAASIATWRKLDWKVLKFDPEHLFTPDYLVTDGVYRYTRNPLYLGDWTMWAGWAALLGSIPITIGLAVLVSFLQVAVRFEEWGLASQHSEQWERYAATTPRFLGVRHPTIS